MKPIEAAIAQSARVRTQRMLERIESGIKRCPRCEQTKAISDFYECPSRAGDHLSQLCKVCTSQVAVIWVRERREQAKAAELARIEAERVALEAARLEAERARAARSRAQAEARTRSPRFQLPTPPDFSRGLCTTAPASQRAWWTSADKDEREAAARMCRTCPILAPCEAWALQLPSIDSASVYAGLLPAERLRRKRELLNAIAAQVLRT